ncbi:putative coenzyme F420-dependent N5,N10-methylene tetrahydromethanopterin reductase [Burkholderia cenocepacia]|uniref:Coenzyme F420-dependent N5,N10-methylene tetrahydromethanopterin reductase n=1 Tax=Burkholderia cenocepacia TaxID=95486 RepID=A0AAN0VRP1_9BURK|nr:putative coenzyme F420-dependent N5,N10-methylene tetrahydromethanopterin reductase [Burkholderia cenocepacia]
MYAPDLVGTADEIVGMLLDDSVLAQIRELRLELPYDLPFENYGQILRDFITRLVTELGWRSMAMRWTAVA